MKVALIGVNTFQLQSVMDMEQTNSLKLSYLSIKQFEKLISLKILDFDFFIIGNNLENQLKTIQTVLGINRDILILALCKQDEINSVKTHLRTSTIFAANVSLLSENQNLPYYLKKLIEKQQKQSRYQALLKTVNNQMRA